MCHRIPRGKNKEFGERAKFKFGQLTLGKIIKIVATRYHSLRLKCTKFGFSLAPRNQKYTHNQQLTIAFPNSIEQ